VRWKAGRDIQAWQCPTGLAKAFHALTQGQGVRLVLATPGIFQQGWLPDWIKQDWKGKPPGSSVELQLIGACVERWKPISGWGLENSKVGAKAIRRLVPAGSVYFFKVTKGSAAELADKLWLQSVADDEQDRRDGFGLALWGLWNPQQGGL
jgi:CRISPR-associated protein Cmr3